MTPDAYYAAAGLAATAGLCWGCWRGVRRIARYARRVVQRIRARNGRLATEAWVRATELQAEDDLATCHAIDALGAHDPRTSP